MTTKTRLLNSIRALLKNNFCENLLRYFIKKGLFSKLAPNHYQYKANTFRKITIEGINMNIDISDYVGHYLYFGFDDVSANSLFSLVQPGATIFDIGANIGFTVLTMAKKNQPNGKVYAFEPDPYNYLQLKNNIGLNNFPMLQIFNLGLGSKKEQLKLAVNTANNRGGNRIKSDATENYNLVEIVKLDDFITENKIEKIDLIKIDVEGFEMNVLQGAKNCLDTWSPVLFIELSDNNLKEQASSAKELVLFLNNKGYTAISSDTKKTVTANDNFLNCHYDIICKKN